ncbi:uncharacterized protein LOC142498794 isoform X4 [Ascaphus truei]|uniref:uncharacterized protein LOC142498794 isoform X4 n=1 Tax=Ascaphus truei TaxID=8439 RepID=UPI003F5975B1
MALIFSDTEYSAHYQKYMLPASEKMVQMMLSYLITKKGKPFELAVDVGCGTGRYTRPVAPHFEKVIGLDISESQLNKARRSTSEKNVLYHTSPAEEMPLKDASVDLVFAGLAAHWFIIDKFMQEAARVLKPGGCLALHAFIPIFEIQYQDVSETLTAIITETMNVLFKYRDKTSDVMNNQYRELFEAVPFADKQSYANIFMGRWKEAYNWAHGPFGANLVLWKRYIDDVLCVWRASEEDLVKFKDYLNTNN